MQYNFNEEKLNKQNKKKKELISTTVHCEYMSSMITLLAEMLNTLDTVIKLLLHRKYLILLPGTDIVMESWLVSFCKNLW